MGLADASGSFARFSSHSGQPLIQGLFLSSGKSPSMSVLQAFWLSQRHPLSSDEAIFPETPKS